jgi:hypothetical protein
MSVNLNKVDCMVDYTRYQVGCEGLCSFFCSFIIFSQLLTKFIFLLKFLEHIIIVALSYAVYLQKLKLSLSPTLTSPTSSQTVAPNSDRKRNIDNFTFSQALSHLARVNSLGVNMSSRASICVTKLYSQN